MKKKHHSSKTIKKRHHLSGLFTILVLSILLTDRNTISAGEIREYFFEKYEVVTDSTNRQTILTGHLLGRIISELAIVEIDHNKRRHLHIYTFEDSRWVKKFSESLRPKVMYVDVAGIDGRDRIVTYEPGRLNWFDPELAIEHSLLSVTSNFNPPNRDEVPHVDITQDLNEDGRDDLVVPDVDGFWVFIQLEEGAFADPVKIGPPADLRGIYGADGYRYDPWSQGRIHKVDYNGDGRSDLVYWKKDHFEAYMQGVYGVFAASAKTFKTDVTFDSDDSFSLATGDMNGRVLHSIADLNNDGVPDLVIYSLEGGRISKKHSSYEVHFGAHTPAGRTIFNRDIDVAFRSDDRIQLGMAIDDFDSDGQLDLMLTTIDRRYLKGSIWLNLEFYRSENGVFPDKPNIAHRIGLIGAPDHRSAGWVPLDIVLRGRTHESRKHQERWLRAFDKNLLIGDVTGDGLSDLLIERTFRGLDLHVGVTGPDLFDPQPKGVSVIVPNDGEYTLLVDLNKDGKQDILMHHPYNLRDIHGAPRHPPGTEPHRLTILIAQ